MMKRRALRLWGFGALMVLGLSACGDEVVEDDAPVTADPADSEAPTSDLDVLLEGAPDNDKLPSEAKADEVFPKAFDLVALQSPVKSQGSRGVCSIFSTVALMEHLYIKEGTLRNPDFSEQYLQWSAKEEVKRFRQTSGSNASTNLDAISRFGIVDEPEWPYETFKWTATHDERCTGEDDQPTLCYTNGEPPETVKDATKWRLPRGRWVSSNVRSIKAVMKNQGTGVVAGMTFFYQSWNHRRSKLPTNSDYWSEGYVLPPNEKDREISLEKRAGHSILLVGWDDELEVPLVDAEGNTVKDDNGDPVIEKGFFMFKNSWGTSGFGIRHPAGAGYGWIAYSYIEEFANTMTAAAPKLDLAPETCDDGIDNNADRQIDCDDPQCADAAFCQPEPADDDLSNTTVVAIPDNNLEGISSTIDVSTAGVVAKVTVEVDITHSFASDLVVSLVAPDGTEAVLRKNTGVGVENLSEVYTPVEMINATVAGTWTLKVADTVAEDEGTLNAWSLSFDVSDVPLAEVCDDGEDNLGNGLVDCADPACAGEAICQAATNLSGTDTPGVAIPDNNAGGVPSIITLSGAGTVDTVTVSVDIDHTYIGDLVIALTHADGTTVTLSERQGGDLDNLIEEFTTADFAGKPAAGDWTLNVSDRAREDVGVLNFWSIDVQLQ